MKRAGSTGKFGMVLAGIFIAFGVINLVHPMQLSFFQLTCGKPMFFSCNTPPQELTEIGSRVFGLFSTLLGLGIGWLAWQRPRG